MKLIGKPICWMKGKHKRGRLVGTDGVTAIYRFPRCGRRTQYKVKTS